METLSFTLGVLTVIDLSLVVGTFLVLKTMNITRKQAENTQRDLENAINDLYTQLDKVENQLSDKIDRNEELVVRHTDSRVDKLEAKIYNELNLKKAQRS